MLAGVEPVATYHNAVAWTGYILFVDALVFRLEGASFLVSRTKWFFFSLPAAFAVYAIFELYNYLAVHAWVYHYSVPNIWAWALLFGWGWVQVVPSLFETMSLFSALGLFKDASGPCLDITKRTFVLLQGLACVLLVFPLVASRFYPLEGVIYGGCMFFGFLLLFDGINYRVGKRSLLSDLERGYWGNVLNLALVGIFCGFLWEFWNYWATGKWIYIVPVLPHPKIFEMPILGYLYFVPFSLASYAMFEFITGKPSRRSEVVWSKSEKLRAA